MAKTRTSFKEGNPGKPHGAVSEKTKLWNKLKDFVTGEGAEKFQAELMTLQGREYITAYTNILEYFQPKLARVETKTDDDSKLTVEIVRTNYAESSD